MMRPLTTRGTPRQREYVTTRAKRGMSPAERIKLHVKVAANGCWVWQQALANTGYGRLTMNGRSGYYAHRVSYEAFVGPIPEGMHLDHLCRNRACCNPEHLEPVTPLVNVRRSPIAHGSETHCPRDHPYDEANTYRTRDGKRQCRTCRLAYVRIFKAMTPEHRAARKSAGIPVVDLAAHFADQPQEIAA